MAGQKASVDRDKSYDLINPFTGQPQSAPDAERETAYYDQKEITGTEKTKDPYDNDDEVYNGIEKDTSRIADKRDALANAVKSGNMKKLSENKRNPVSGQDVKITPVERGLKTGAAHRWVVRQMRGTQRSAETTLSRGAKALDPTQQRATIREAENPMVASAPATSDSPMLGMLAMNPNSGNKSKYDVGSMLESIALQAAETFEAMDENTNIPDSFGSELEQCSQVLNKLNQYVTQGQNNYPAGASVPVPAQPFMTKESYELEEELVGDQHKLDHNKNNEIDSEDLAIARAKGKAENKAKAKMAEAAFGVFGYILRNGR